MLSEGEIIKRYEFKEVLELLVASEQFQKDGEFIFEGTQYPLMVGMSLANFKDMMDAVKRRGDLKLFSFNNYKLGEKENTETTLVTYGDVLGSLLQKLPVLTHISLSGTYMDKDESFVVVKSITMSSCRLRALTFDTNVVDLNSLTALANILEQPKCTLKYLQLQRCLISGFRPKLHVLIDALKKNNSLRKLDLTLCDFEDDELNALSQMLDINQHLVTLQFGAKNPHHEAIKDITQKLRRNREAQVKLHSTLTAHTAVTDEARSAILQENDSYLEVLLGAPKRNQDESEEYERTNTALSKSLQEEIVRLAILQSQHQTLLDSPKTAVSTEIQEALDRRMNELRKELEEEFEKVSSATSNQEKTRSELRVKNQLLEDYRSDTLDPLFNALRLKLTGTDPIILVKNDLKDKLEKAQKNINLLKESQQQLLDHHMQYVTKRTTLLRALNKLVLSPTLETEKEEIAEALIEVNIKPEDRDNEGQTILFTAFIHGKLKNFETLLNAGGNILAANNDGNSIFIELMKNYQLRPTFNSAKKHLEKILIEDFGKLRIQEQSLLDQYKELLIEYLTVFSIQNRATRVSASVSSEPPAAAKDGPVLLSDNTPHLAGLNLLARALYQMIIILKACAQGKLSYLPHNPVSVAVAQFIEEFDFENLRRILMNLKYKGPRAYQSFLSSRQVPAALELKSLESTKTALPVTLKEEYKALAVKRPNGKQSHDYSVQRNYSFIGSDSGTTMLSYFAQLAQDEESSGPQL